MSATYDEWEHPASQSEMVEMRHAYVELKSAQSRVDAAHEAARKAGWVMVGTNRYARRVERLPTSAQAAAPPPKSAVRRPNR